MSPLNTTVPELVETDRAALWRHSPTLLRASLGGRLLPADYGLRLLRLAIAERWPEGLRILLEQGADPRANRSQALYRALTYPDMVAAMEMTDLLLQHGARFGDLYSSQLGILRQMCLGTAGLQRYLPAILRAEIPTTP